MAGEFTVSERGNFLWNDDHVSVLSGTLTGAVNSLVSLVPSAISLGISAGRLMDIVEMPQEDYSADGEVERFAEKYQSGGIGLKMQDLCYTYHTGRKCFRMLRWKRGRMRLLHWLAHREGEKQPCSA